MDMDHIPNSVQELQEQLAESSKARNGSRLSQQPGWDGKPKPVPEDMGPGAPYSVQGRVTGSPYDNIPAGYALGPLQSILNVIIQGSQDEIIPWSWWPMLRDKQLRNLWKTENLMAGAVYALSGRVKALPWEVVTPRIRIQQKYQSLIASCDLGDGWGMFITRTVIDMLTQDNGAFWELLGAGDPEKKIVGPVLGIAHLDSSMIWRTHDSEIPAIYINPYTGQYHGVHRSRIVRMSSMTQPDELARGVGFCAVSRAERWLRIAFSEANYRDEKISGRFKRAIVYGSGITTKQYDNAMDAAREADDAVGRTSYSGIPVLLTMQPDMKLNILELARLPDGFNFKEEVDTYINVLALSLGVDAREFWPGTASGATKADANMQHLKAQGKGVADILQTIERALNWYVLPEGVRFAFDFTDEERALMQAQINQTEAQTLNLLNMTTAISGPEVRALSVHKEIIDEDAMKSPSPPIVATDEAPVPANPTTAEDTSENMPPEINVKTKTKIADWHDRTPLADQTPIIVAATKATVDPHAIVGKYSTDLRNIFANYLKHRTIQTLRQDFRDVMSHHLRTAYSVGLNGAYPTDDGLQDLQDIAQTSSDYFDGFADDADQLPDGSTDEIVQANDVFSNRISTYAGAAWMAIWAGLGNQLSQADTPPRVMRRLDPMADHCSTCPDKAGIYDSYDEMESEAGVPGDGSDDCLSNCRCELLVENADGDFTSLLGQPDISTVPLFSLIGGQGEKSFFFAFKGSPDQPRDENGRWSAAGGAYGHMKVNQGEEIHHMPANEASHSISEANGPAIRMSKGDHALTASYGKKDSARLYREQQHQLISQGKLREAIQMDIDDIHATFGDKYDQGIKQMLQYADRLNYNKRSGIPINPTFKQARSIARSMGR
jgi:hypothetical protein